jgi:hypothetical protein
MMDDGMAGTGKLLIRNGGKPSRMIEHPVPVSHHERLTYWRKLLLEIR